MTDQIIYKWGPVSFDGIKIKGQIVHLDHQKNNVYVWVKEDFGKELLYDDNDQEIRKIRIHPTGVSFSGQYIGTVVTDNELVWHVIEEPRK